ncbi:MAG: leucine-rich repeat protein, partial [Clostridia bacterium]|nr:leucine-rich repeat protein [Clostridia bacterium]
CISLQSVTFREKLTTIESSAFKNCTSLSEIVLPATLTQIDVEAFMGSGVQSVTFLNPENWYLVESVGESVEGVKSLDLSIVANNAKNLKGEYSSKILIRRI